MFKLKKIIFIIIIFFIIITIWSLTNTFCSSLFFHFNLLYFTFNTKKNLYALFVCIFYPLFSTSYLPPPLYILPTTNPINFIRMRLFKWCSRSWCQSIAIAFSSSILSLQCMILPEVHPPSCFFFAFPLSPAFHSHSFHHHIFYENTKFIWNRIASSKISHTCHEYIFTYIYENISMYLYAYIFTWKSNLLNCLHVPFCIRTLASSSLSSSSSFIKKNKKTKNFFYIFIALYAPPLLNKKK